MTDYLTVAEVLAIHEDQIARYVGSLGIRDCGLLEAALFRPRTGCYADILEEAAALWESLSRDHPFIDRNKRTAFAGTYIFLAINGALHFGVAAGSSNDRVPPKPASFCPRAHHRLAQSLPQTGEGLGRCQYATAHRPVQAPAAISQNGSQPVGPPNWAAL
jgi:death-on-curing protein